MVISFHGAAREVTGSNVLVEAGGKKFLLDCGFFQGARVSEERNAAPFGYDPKFIDFVVVCHAHLDHTGRLPKLVKEGFDGRIYATAPTKELTRLVLEDSKKLMDEEARRDKHPPLYEYADIERVMQLFETVSYGELLEVDPGIKLTLKNAGHILGSAVAVIEADGKKLVYTSDLGNNPSELLSAPDTIDKADYVICESTYGGRIHEPLSKRQEKLGAVISATVSNNGVLMIPTFAIERTQELLHDIEGYCNDVSCEIPNFFLDSPLAIKVTTVFEKYPEFLAAGLVKERGEDIFSLARIKVCQTVGESRAIDGFPNPKIIIAGSGMMNGGRILHHLQNYIEDPKNRVLVVGYQAQGTLGRRLLDGEKEVKIFGKKYDVEAQVSAIGSYSAHADQPQILAWLGQIRDTSKVFLVHGETDQMDALAKKINSDLHTATVMPQQGEKYEL